MQSGTKCWQAARRGSSRGDIELGVEVWRLLTCLKKKKAVGIEIVWVTRDQFRFDMGVRGEG